MMPLMTIWKAKSLETDQQTIENWYKKDNTNGIYPLQFLMIFGNKNTDHRRMNDGLCFFYITTFQKVNVATATIL